MGVITIKTANDDDVNSGMPIALIIEFSDNGIGMNHHQLQTIFDPFFTTKEPGKGTGLGLAVSYMIVDGMNGKIYANSKINQGTTFWLAFPLSKNTTSAEENRS